MSIVELSKNIDEVILKHDLNNEASLFKNEFAILKTEDLVKTLESIDEQGRVLKIGVVGRVKAGKSSLLNALIFEGKNVLPKAATPMTAALTIMEYGEETKAIVDFFSQEDIDDIQKDYDKYISELKYLKDKKYRELKERHIKKLKKEQTKEEEKGKLDRVKELLKKDVTEVFGIENENKLQEKAEKQAKTDLNSNGSLLSSYDQYSRIKDAGIDVEALSQYKEIYADTIEELNSKLNDFVGADGKYMPFTKSVTLQLNEEKLKEIQIIDTPGINDPVTSREERTKELLKFCDVVLIVSPSGQFLSSEDMDLFDRITSKEGIKEVYIVASQVDLQLFGGEKEKADGILSKALSNISSNLTSHMQTVFQKDEYLKDNPTFKALLKKDVLYSSGIAYALLQKFDSKEVWDTNEKHVWDMLQVQYKDYFDEKNSAKENLKKLANISKIQEILDDVKVKKDKILELKKENFVESKSKSLVQYKNALYKEIEAKITRVQNSDIESIKEKKQIMESIKKNVSIAVTDEYADILVRMEIDIKSILNDKLNSYFKKSKRDLSDSAESETEHYTYDHGFFSTKWFSDRYEKRENTYTTVKAGFIRNSFEDLTDDIESTIDVDAKGYLLHWRKELPKAIISVLRREAGDENLEISLISQTIRRVVNTVEYPEIDFGGGLPSALRKSGTLKEYEAEKFLEEADNYINDLRKRVKKDIKSYITTLLSALQEVNIANDVFKNYISVIEDLENAIENKELMLDNYQMILKSLKAIDGK